MSLNVTLKVSEIKGPMTTETKPVDYARNERQQLIREANLAECIVCPKTMRIKTLEASARVAMHFLEGGQAEWAKQALEIGIRTSQ